jgi:aspartyl-tRNA(Asn)/glutamyl-tRNA(Gln) amidotransferase subunit A
VARLREADAVFLGKTTTSELGWKGTGDSPRTGVARNAVLPSLTSGGSSGGAATAAAAWLGQFQLGTDGGGSVRIPASFCGVAGMKATFGRIPLWPTGPMLTLSHVGPIARTIDDVRRLFAVISQPDVRDWSGVPAPALRRAPAHQLCGKRLGLHRGAEVCESPVNDVVEGFVNLLSAGAIVEEVSLPLGEAGPLIHTHWEAGAAWLVSQVPVERRPATDQGLRDAAAREARISLPEYYAAMVKRVQFGEKLRSAGAPYDALLMPTVPILPFEAGRDAPPRAASQNWLDWNPFTHPFNLSRQPAISIPAGFSDTGVPVGVQLVGQLYEDEWVLNLAQLIEQALGHPQRGALLSNESVA